MVRQRVKLLTMTRAVQVLLSISLGCMCLGEGRVLISNSTLMNMLETYSE